MEAQSTCRVPADRRRRRAGQGRPTGDGGVSGEGRGRQGVRDRTGGRRSPYPREGGRSSEASAQQPAGVGVGGTALPVRRLLLGGSRAHAWETGSGCTRLDACGMSSQSLYSADGMNEGRLGKFMWAEKD
jgi:hypothetical protein